MANYLRDEILEESLHADILNKYGIKGMYLMLTDSSTMLSKECMHENKSQSI